MDTKTAAMRISRQLKACEDDSDRLLAQMATLVVEMTNARIESGAKSGTGQRALARVIDSQRAVGEAQQSLIRAHVDLLRIGTERGDIPEGQCPPAAGALSAVA